MEITEKELLELFDISIHCISERGFINFEKFKVIQKLFKENKIIVKIKSE